MLYIARKEQERVKMAQINVRVNDDVKKEAESVLDEIGMSVTTAVTIFLKTVARERRIPFEVTADPFYSESNMLFLAEKMAEYKYGTLKTEEHPLDK